MACDPATTITSAELTGLNSDIQTIDDVVESSLDTTTTKNGKTINTLLGQLRLLGYLPPVTYAGAIAFGSSDNTKTIDRNGIIYAPKPSELPFTTSGTWAADDENKFFIIQSVTLTSDQSYTNTKDTVADMVAATDIVVGQRVVTKGYSTAGDGAGAEYLAVPLQTTDGFGDHSGASVSFLLQTRGCALVNQFGAVGDKVTDDTAAIKAAIAYAEAKVVGRFDSGFAICFLSGDYLITSTLEITSSRIYLLGQDWASTVLYAPNADFDLVHFNGTALSLYGCGAANIRFNTPGNTTAGGHLRTTKLIDASFDKLYFVGHFDGLISDGCARTYYTDVVFTQDTRTTLTSPRYAMDFRSDNGANNSDVHVSTYQIFMPDDRKTPYSTSIRGADGIYFNNGHHQGGVLVQPDGEGLNVCASVFWSEVYMDKADAENIIFTGTSAAYRNFQFNGVYLRGSVYGMVVNTTGLVEKVKFVGGEVSGHTKSGVDFRNTNAKKFKFVGTDFDTNCSDNILGDSDIITRGYSHIVSACNFSSGTANGRGVNLAADSTNCTVGDSDFSESTQGIKLINSGTGNKLGVNNGVVYKNKGTATILNATTSITVNHGMDVAPDIDSIQVTPRTSLNGGVDFWISNVNSTSFDINVSNAVSNNTVFSWVVDLTGV